eukprot:scaffold29195_cov69-Cyclotella_meneghiniana.AAC.18
MEETMMLLHQFSSEFSPFLGRHLSPVEDEGPMNRHTRGQKSMKGVSNFVGVGSDELMGMSIVQTIAVNSCKIVIFFNCNCNCNRRQSIEPPIGNVGNRVLSIDNCVKRLSNGLRFAMDAAKFTPY